MKQHIIIYSTIVICFIALMIYVKHKTSLLNTEIASNYTIYKNSLDRIGNTFSIFIRYNNKAVNNVLLDEKSDLWLSQITKPNTLVLYYKNYHCLDCVVEVLNSLGEIIKKEGDKVLVLTSFSDDLSFDETMKPFKHLTHYNLKDQELVSTGFDAPFMFILDSMMRITSPYIPIRGLQQFNDLYINSFLLNQ